jgi:tetratricopeptide (TPR) repeat protein
MCLALSDFFNYKLPDMSAYGASMDDRLMRGLTLVAIALTIAFAGWAAYDNFLAWEELGDRSYLAGNRAFEDGDYLAAEAAYRAALSEDPMHFLALRGLARSLHQRGANEDALLTYDEAIAHDPGSGATYADRGSLLDAMGRQEEALADYMRALELEPGLAAGPNWLTGFLRQRPEAPPDIADRASQLRAALAKPGAERAAQGGSQQQPRER